MRLRDGATLAKIFVVGAAIGLGIAVAPQLAALIEATPPVAYPERPVSCPPPRSELEQMHIIVVYRDGRLHAQCMFVGSRGTYTGARR